ncbi:MAG TPA: triple tyrosine motif-containing protein, partial [Chitinophagaceae bacterium]
IGTDKGLQIFLKNGKTKLITQKDGLMHSRAENLLLDKHDRMWIGNDVGIACFNMADSSMKYFDEAYGLSIQGFRVSSTWQTSEDEQIWGTENGIQYFFPDKLYNYKADLKVAINRIESRNIFTNLVQSKSYRLAANDNYITFYFSTIEYLPKLRTFYEYKLEGLDEDWIKVANQNSVRYTGLPPGKYSFKVRASNDNKVWTNAENEVLITIAVPFYNSWWFKALAVLTAMLLLWYVFRYYRKKQLERQEELETEVVINYFASQINGRYRSDELLWDVARNLIGKMEFEDCMIYLWNEDKTMLVQKAGYGSKGSMQEIMDKTAYHIPKGKGIVGAAVESKHSVLVNDTSKDKRYFTADGKIMLSELCVPLIHDNEVLGAINTENRRRNFFTAKHQKMLSTIAVLCANQLQRIRAEEEKQQARIEALQNKQKMTESRLQSLRLQMNPHFLFNALNSMQQMILANEEMVATRYLSKFSKLLRTILIHSDKEMVSLKEELEILNL